MYTKKQLAILVSAAVVLFLVGFALGYLLHPQKAADKVKIQAATNLSSKVVSSVVAYGQVKSISGRNITLSNLGDSLTILVAADAPIYSFIVKDKATAPVQQKVSFGSIKIGDSVNVAVKTLSSGQLEGSSVIILPVPAK
jgi:hypothetical protein